MDGHSASLLDPVKLIEKKINPADIKPIWGYRFQIMGDFDADGMQDTLREHFYSKRDHRETNKYFSGIDDVWILYDSAYARDCNSFFLCNNPKFDTIPIKGIFGPLWLRNEGDIDKDGGDEISFVESKPQQSSMNHCIILSFKNGKWEEIYRFSVREWQFPPLPQAGKAYGLFGVSGSYSVDDNDTTNLKLQKQYDEFPGLITKLRTGNVKIQTFTSEANDTTLILDLSKHPKNYN
ncbi:hypothetical protein BH11BAC3_BH11BAC3_19860 [soil metagenome]